MINAYYVLEDGQQTGPFTNTELMERGVGPDELLLSPISNQWESAGSLAEFYDYFDSIGIWYPAPGIFANFWWRLLAYAIDYVLLIIGLVALGVVYGFFIAYKGANLDFDTDDQYDLKFRILFLLVSIFYNAIFESTRPQGSIGKIICRLKVVNKEGGRISFSKALKRNLGKILSSLLCGAGFLSIFWNVNKQGWHDEMAKTYVIRKRY